MTLTVGSTFTGIGGMDLAAQRAGCDVLWSSEIDDDCRQVLAARFPDVKQHGSITEIGHGSHVGTAVEPVDVLCGGFPCQDLSVAGRQAGLAGARSGLFYEFARVAAETGPTWIVLENVPGLLSSNNGRDMGAVIGTLEDLGFGVAWRVLDAQYFGVAQRRRRVIIVGHLGGGTDAAEILFEPESSVRNLAPSRQPGQGATVGTLAGTSPGGGWRIGADEAAAGHLIPAVAPTLEAVPTMRATMGSGTSGHHWDGYVIPATSNALCASRGQRNDPTEQTFLPMAFQCQGSNVGPMGTLRTGHNVGSGVPFVSVAVSENQRGECVLTDYSHQLTTGGGKPGQGYPAALTDLGVRRLTPLECERLQGFPDGWTDVPNSRGKPMADSPRYRMLGNAVAVPVFRWVFERIANHK